LERFTLCLLTCAFSAILIAELSSAFIIQSHSKKIQINEEDIPELGTKTLKNWFHRQGIIAPQNSLPLSGHPKCGHCVICQKPQQSSPEPDTKMLGRKPGGGYV
jgi:hypothetical protein